MPENRINTECGEFPGRRIMFEDINKLSISKSGGSSLKGRICGFLIVDRTKFAITGRKNAKIYFLPIPRKGNTKKFERAIHAWAAAPQTQSVQTGDTAIQVRSACSDTCIYRWRSGTGRSWTGEQKHPAGRKRMLPLPAGR